MCNKDQYIFANTISKLYAAVLALVAATGDSLAERLRSIHEIILYNRMIGSINYEQEKLKKLVEKEVTEQEGETTEQDKEQT